MPPAQTLSAPVGYLTNNSIVKGESHNTSHKVQDPLSDSTPTMNSLEAESIDRQLNYATAEILRERYRLNDGQESTTPEEVTSPSAMNRGRSETLSWSQYVTPGHTPSFEIDIDNPIPNPQQKPEQLMDEVYFNHRSQVYQSLQEKHTLDLRSCAIYHAQRDKCF